MIVMYERTVLRNGIKVITHEIPHLLSVSVGVWVKMGSRYEEREKNGISHFIEHMLFKGTEKRSAQDIAREIDSVGGTLNAFTSREYTAFYAKTLKEDLTLSMDLLSDIYLHSLFGAEEISKERMVILEEINLVKDTPDDLIHDLFVMNLWKDHPLGYSILGTHETVSAITREDIRDYYENFYLGFPILVTASGRLKHRDVVEMVEEALGGLSYNGKERNPPPPQARPGIHVEERDLEQIHLCLGFPAIPQNHPKRYPAYLLNTIIGGGMSSRLFQEVREKRGLVYSIYSYLGCYQDAGAFTIYAGTSEGACYEVLSVILDELKRLVDEGVGEEELTRAKEQLKGNLLLGLEGSESRMVKLAKDELYHGRYIPPEEIMEEIDRVLPEEIQDLARDMIRHEQMTLVLLGKAKLSKVEVLLRP